MTESKIVRCAGCGVEMANPDYGQHTRQWLYYCPTCRKYREKNDDGDEDEDE
ncbi:MAG: hypothetical protein I3273_03665 [Candidatus Moeniiplasma glomeromycotorum]|nr:hypothetical protein [Candidatus Moeniiplasma glomeromycotorum]MCE8167971.1 hypothetical protein [Candidatus Moeniiplasma glomeromycotorum]MCE8169194.1 hypothetical protein [Candidatus Moeniiplasma glomeromycotorum]